MRTDDSQPYLARRDQSTGDEIADEWAKRATGEPDAHGVEWLNLTDPHGIVKKSATSQTEARDWMGESSPEPATESSTQVPNRNWIRRWYAPTNDSPHDSTNSRRATV